MADCRPWAPQCRRTSGADLAVLSLEAAAEPLECGDHGVNDGSMSGKAKLIRRGKIFTLCENCDWSLRWLSLFLPKNSFAHIILHYRAEGSIEARIRL